MFLRPRSWLPRRIIELYDAHRFDAVTAWGQFRQKPYKRKEFDYLQVGSGKNLLPGFLNTDHFISRLVPLGLDIRYPLPFDNERWTGIYAHHIVEHVRYSKAVDFFKEVYRTLKPGGIFRVVVPDAEAVLRLYTIPESERLKRLYDILPIGHRDEIEPKTALGMINWVFYCGDLAHAAHFCAWDFETMQLVLRDAGFSNVIRVEFGVSRDPKMTGIDKPLHWAPHSLYVEAVK